MSSLYHTIFFDPLYNALILLFKVVPWIDAGVAVIILTVLVRFLLYPLSRKAVVTQARMNEIGPQVEAIKEKYKDKPEEQARKTLELYREKDVNPFSGIIVIIIQIPLILALYQIFIHFPTVNQALLYSFVSAPASIDTTFFGIDITTKSVILALLAAVSSFFQFKVSSMAQKANNGSSFSDNLTRSMQTQSKYFFPFIMFFIAYKISGVIGLYFLTTNLFSIAQELYVRKSLKTLKA